MKKRLALAGTIIAIAAGVTVSQVIPQPTSELKPVYRMYLPMIQRQPIQKKGIGLPKEHQDCSQIGLVNAAWYYDWSPTPLDCWDAESVSMVWGKSIPSFITGTSPYLLGFNEPDRADQSNLTPQEAAQLWGYIESYYPNKKLISPAPSHENPEWLREWYVLAQPQLAGLALHCYLPTAQECIDLVQKYISWAREWDVPEIWVTEFAFEDWAEAQVFIEWMEREPIVRRYAWFASRIDGDESWAKEMGWKAPLLDADDALTLWGEHYR